MIIKVILFVVSFSALGLVLYILFGKNRKPWNEMTENEKRKNKALIAGGTAVFLAGLLAALTAGKKKH